MKSLKKNLISKIITSKEEDYKNCFPLPLSKHDQEKYLNLAQNGDKKAKEILIERNARLVVFRAKKYYKMENIDDIISVGFIGLIKAVSSFKFEKSASFPTYASRCIENEILMFLRKKRIYKKYVASEKELSHKSNDEEYDISNELTENEYDNINEILDSKFMKHDIEQLMKSVLNDLQYSVISLRYGFVDNVFHTQQEVSKILNLSRGYIAKTEIKAKQILAEEMPYIIIRDKYPTVFD